MLQFKNIASTRTVTPSKEVEVIATTTSGEFKITPLAAEKIGIQEGDFVAVVVLDKDVYIGKGKTGIPVTDANGTPLKDTRNRTIYEEGTTYGSLARTLTEGASTIRITSTGGWKALEGSEDVNKVFSLEEGVEGQVAVSNEKDAELHTATFYKLTFKKEVAKIIRTKGANTSEEDEDASNLEVNATAVNVEAEAEDVEWEN